MELLRESLEDAEASMWNKHFFSKNLPNASHSYFFKGLSRIERLPFYKSEDSGPCDTCGKASLYKCSDCYVGIYCCKEHQSLDWEKHKPSCKTIKRALAEELKPTDASEFVGKCFVKSLQKPLCVIILLNYRKTHAVYMSKEDMNDYGRFVAAIQSVIPSFRKVKDHGWQHWETVRNY